MQTHLKRNKIMEQTAVDWLIEQLYGNNEIFGVSTDLYEQAKEMEKSQIIDAGNSCALMQHIHNDKIDKMTMDEMLDFENTETISFGEQYYNETYLSQQDKP